MSLRAKTYLFIFLLALAEGLALTSNSPFIAEVAGEHTVSAIYALASLIALLVLFVLPHLVRIHGRGRVLSDLLLIGALASCATALLPAALPIIAILVYLSVPQIAPAVSDIYIEAESVAGERGRVVGSAYTFMNLAYMLGPISGGAILYLTGFASLYVLTGAVFLSAYLVLRTFAHLVPSVHQRAGSMLGSIGHAWRTSNLRYILLSYFALQFFFSWTIIYTPLYLLSKFNFSYETLGLIFSIMLVPYVLIEYPLGIIADKWLGEKELLIAGFAIVAIFIGIVPFVTVGTWWVWALILFGTRVGTAMIESMTAVYFHKQVAADDVDMLTLFRNMRPLGYLVGPFIAYLLVPNIVGIPALFTLLGLLMLSSILFIVPLRDTR